MTTVKISVLDVSKYTCLSAPLIRKLMREGRLNIGLCFKHGDKWYYHIIEKDLRNVYGDVLVDAIIAEKVG